ncbi:phage portal protein [Pararhodospirillum photometricum]|uniref:Probable capsid portal protein n=1 Tax=Pararhodospirillum photometricum DSM 122 TaxID=1150469 RepID=H6SQH6_PARPM|nr:phage portal protein [Pararhodospirillum photometricum]CCG09695.1 Probable capsid portal protein [Pararhodospirillum photometricum DSM 122]
MSNSKAPGSISAFTFGDPVPVLDHREIGGYFHSAFNGSFYEPPVSFDGLARALLANPHHQSAVALKVQKLAAAYRPHPLLSRTDCKRLVQDFVVFGNAWLERIDNVFGKPLTLRPTLARYTRQRPDGRAVLLVDGVEHVFAPEATLHLCEPDVSQEVYGRPSYEAALQSAFLNEAATLFRRKYYVNGSHAGFILYMTDPAQTQEDVDTLRDALKNAKGPGNFRNLFLYSPNGKKDGLQVIPISEVMAKDEFLNMKNVTRDDLLAAHRVPPQLLGIVPSNAGGFGDIEKASRVWAALELGPLGEALADPINRWLGEKVVLFEGLVSGS